jgi:hypothetical protein
MVASRDSGLSRVATPGAGARPGRARLLAPVRWAGPTLLAVAVLMICYLRISGTVPVISDGAGNTLQAWDMLHGNLLLHGWWVTDVSFYTTELPQYALVEAVAGLRPEVLHICAAMTYTLLVLLAASVARGRARGAEGVVRAVLAAGIMLAPEPGVATEVLLNNPDHVGTAVPVLLLLFLLDRGHPSWWQPVAAFVVLSAAIVGDPLTEVIGVLPLAVLCLARIASALLRRRAPLRSLWYEISLGGAAVASVAAAEVAKRLIVALHGFSTNQGNWGLVSLSTVRANIPMVARDFLSLFGADVESAQGGRQQAFAVVHLAGAALVLAALVLAAVGLVRSLWSRAPGPVSEPGSDGAASAPGDLVSGLLVLAIVFNVGVYMLMYSITIIFAEHEIAPIVALGAALAGRQLGGPLLRPRARRQRGGLVAALAAGVACYSVMLGYAAARPQAKPANAALAIWLTEHQLRSGIAGYWQASSVTLDTHGAITMGSVRPDRGGLAPWHWEMDMRLFDPATHSANFVVSTPGDSVTPARAMLALGRPSRVYHFQIYTIMVWNKNILRDLGRPVSS